MRIKSFRILALSVALVFLSTSSVYAGNYFGKCSSAKIYKTSKNIKGIKNILPQIKGPKKPKDHPVVKKPIKGTGVTELTLNKTTTTIAVGSWERLFASVKPANVVNKHILWFSTRPDIATVNPSGKVTGIRPGEAVIYAVSRYDFTKLATCTVTVGQNKTSPSTGQTGIYLNKTSTTMTVGSSQTLTATLKGISSSVTWYSSNPDKVSVDQSGHITAKRTGTAQIFAMTSNGQYVASCTVTVVSANKSITSVSIDTTTSYIALKPGSTKALAATVEPSTATDKSLTWSSGNTSVAVVNQSGVVTAISEGSAVITVRTINGKIDRCTIKVIPEDEWVDVTEVKINLLYTTIPVGETDTL
ncbi:MAG TPA: Ig-like domain-containing protein, partial [Desulfobacteria bacterium]|nr:Ig-like domain-containing protein [Desulfobacteria bacterium]